MKKGNVSFRKKLFRMVSVGVIDEPINQMYDILTTAALIVNLTVTIMNTYDGMRMDSFHLALIQQEWGV